jgi:hypothetical protein
MTKQGKSRKQRKAGAKQTSGWKGIWGEGATEIEPETDLNKECSAPAPRHAAARHVYSNKRLNLLHDTSLTLALAPLLAVGLVRLPVRQLARLPAVPHLIARRALLEPRAAAAGVRAVRLGLEVRGLASGDTGFSRQARRCCARAGRCCLGVCTRLDEPYDDIFIGGPRMA